MESEEFNAGSITFGVDLRQAALFEIDFLQAVDKRPELLDKNAQALQFAIQRYEKLWLPLVAKYCDRFLAAPMDIEWVWHCHLLNPAAYEKDCRRIVGKVVDHRLLDRERRKQSLQESRVLWRHEYPSVPFEADGPISPWFDSNFMSKLTYNLQAAVNRQQVFYYQVSLPHYRDEKFLAQSVLRYKKFLFVKKLHPNTFIVPCYDIDVIWHAHMLHPLVYRHDTVSIIGHPFNHDDSVNDRRAGSKLTVSDARTRRLWKKTFNEPFSQSGAMFRGEPPAGKLVRIDASDFAALVTKQTTVNLESARVTGLPEHYQGQYKLKLWYNTGYQNFNRGLYVSDNIATVRGSPRHLNSEVRVNANFTFDTKYNDVVMVDLIQKSGRFCLGATAEVGSAQLRMLEKIQALGNGRGITTQDTVDLGDGVGVQLHWSVSPPVTGGYILALRSGDYQDCIMPEMVESMWGPVPLPRLPPGVDNKCSVASHSLLNHTKRVIFTVRIVHSLPLMMSAVHVFFRDKMAAVGHLVGADQLPLPQLVKSIDRCVTLDIKNGERAVLLKNHAGDWGVVLGRWTGMRKPVPASEMSSGQRGIPGDPGHLEIRFFKFATRHWRFLSFERDYSGRDNKFQIEAATVELDSGLIEISSDAGTEVAENLAVAFSVALLHVLCQPRPKDWEPCIEKPPVDVVDGQPVVHRPRMPAEGLALIMAAGFLTLVPSNHLLRKRHREAMESQAEEEARRQRHEEEARRQEQDSLNSEMWAQDASDTASTSQDGVVQVEVTAEDDVSDSPQPNHPSEHQDYPEALQNHPSPTSEGAHLHRLESIAESVEEETAEFRAEMDELNEEDGALEGANPAQHSFNMAPVADSLRQIKAQRHVSWDDETDKVQTPQPEQFPLPVEDLPLPSEEMLRQDPLLEDELVLPDVPDDDLPMLVEELPPPDLSRLNKPQAEALQMSSVDVRERTVKERVVGFDDHSALGYEEYLDTNEDYSEPLEANGEEEEDDISATDFGAQHSYANMDIPQHSHIPHQADDYSHYNGDLPDYTEEYRSALYANGQNDLYTDHYEDSDLVSKDTHVEDHDHFDLYNGDDANDLYVNDSNYISYEDTHNYDGFCVEDLSWGGGGGGGGGEKERDSFSWGGGGEKDRDSFSWGGGGGGERDGDSGSGGGGLYSNCDGDEGGSSVLGAIDWGDGGSGGGGGDGGGVDGGGGGCGG